MKERTWLTSAVVVGGLAVVGTVVLGLGLLQPDDAFTFSSQIYPFVAVGAGLLLTTAALKAHGTERLAWAFTGLGVTLWGAGETIWVWYSLVSHTEVPYPGWADVMYLAGYPAIFVGVLLMPHLRLMRYERLRLTLDALAGSVAIAAVMWTLYLKDIVYFDPEAGVAERYVNVLYPIADVVLLIAVLILVIRRTTLRFDPRLTLLSGALAASAIADVVYVLQVENDTYVDGGRLDAVWLISYGLFVAAAFAVTRPPRVREEENPSQQLWQVVTPYVAVAFLLALTAAELGGDGTVLQWSSAIVAALVVTRQGIAIKENRELVAKQRDDLVASVSHELRTPLTSIRGYTQLLSARWDTFDDGKRRELVTTIESQAAHLSRIATDLVNVARNQLGDVEISPIACDLAEVVREALATTMEPGKPGLQLDIGIEDGVVVLADRVRLHQILTNLLINAERYGRGKIEVVGRAVKTGVLVEIHDNGPGIAKKHETVIWERFERGAHRLDSTIPGSGIGLSIARSLARAHCGSLRYRRSERLGGACFALTLPATEGDPPAVAAGHAVEAPVA